MLERWATNKNNNPKNTIETLNDNAQKDYFDIFTEKYQSKGLDIALEHLKDFFKLELAYNQDSQSNFQEQRHKLETQPGLIISNHPGGLDTLIMLDILKKRISEKGDVKILVAGGELYDRLVSIFSEDIFINAEKGFANLRKIIGESVEHINAGGLLMIYPTGGQEKTFQSGFKSIFKRLPDNAMIYAVNIDEHDLAMASKNTNSGKKDVSRVRVDEIYTTVKEWGDEIAGVNLHEQNDKLTEFYNSKFQESESKKVYTTEKNPEKNELLEKQLESIYDISKKAKEKGCSLYLFAGFADEFLLNNGDIKKKHEDVDFICMRNDAKKVMEALNEIGYTDIKEVFDNGDLYSSELPLKIAAQRGFISVDIPIMDFDEQCQQPFYTITNNDGKKFHIYFEKAFLSDKKIQSPEGELSTVSALGLIQTRIFYSKIEGIELREKDRKAAEALRNKFFPGEDLSNPKFMPKIIEIK